MKSKVLLISCIALSLSLGAQAQKSNADYIEDLKAAGYPVIKPFSFAVTKQKFAFTSLFKSINDKNNLTYTAVINPSKDGANIVFKVFQPCVPSDTTKRLQERIIMVSGQKLEAYYFCGYNNVDSQTQEVYGIKSTAGNDFAKKVFAEIDYVFVHINDMPVPFHTEGFSKAMAESSGKAL